MQAAMLDRGQIAFRTIEILQSTTDLLDDRVLTYRSTESCIEKSRAAIRASKSLIERSDRLIRRINRGLLQAEHCASPPHHPDSHRSDCQSF
jgi:hypothetical protein